ncbi:hypothetical protein HPP92_025080 [Vanilla planifolia]|uniref:Chlororespiratory reduction 4 n=1 Tax=Vanilla planifolia TaxID=51239 RepID=A0A835UBZ2_VANPL|nr:hypothetical protein HPP92_025080 [Vanilla planifolia]
MNATRLLPLGKALVKFFQVASLNATPHRKRLLHSSLRLCSSPKDLKSVHAVMIKSESHQDSFTMNQFITLCSRFNQVDRALLAFKQMEEPNVFVYNAMIGSFFHQTEPIKALQLFVEMLRSEMLPTCHTFSHLIKVCTQIPATGMGESVHGQVRKMGFGCHLVVQTGLINFYTVSNRVEESRRVFDEMSVRDAFSWNTMIFCCVNCGDMETANELFDEMVERNTVSWNTMIAGYARLGDVESAASLFKQMPGKNLISWTSMISCYSHNGLFKEALETFEAMKEAGMSPDKVTMTAVISACAHLGAFEVGRRTHHSAILNGFQIDVYIGSALVDMYAKCGRIERSLVIFFKLEEKNLFCWNSVIDGLAMHGRAKDAFYIFSKMTESHVKPNSVTFVSILSACTHAGLVEEGRKMFLSMTMDHSIAPEMEHYTCMVDLLARAGFLEEALDLIRSMELIPNSVAWRALLSGCKVHENVQVGNFAMDKLMALDPKKSSSYMLLVDMFAKANRWAEVAALRWKLKGMSVLKGIPGCSWIEMDGLIHEFPAADTSHPLLVSF